VVDEVTSAGSAAASRGPARFYEIAGITVQVEADLPMTAETFAAKFRQFEVTGPGPDTVVVRHHFGVPAVAEDELGEQVFRRPPWAVYHRPGRWTYLGIQPLPDDRRLERVVVFDEEHRIGDVYNPAQSEEVFRQGGLVSLTMLPTDQILLARLLADRDGVFLHSGGVILDGCGLLFVGHSDAGKSTSIRFVEDRAEVLCDDRNIVRRTPGGFRVYGTWSHGEVPQVSAASAPLAALLFLRKAERNRLVRIADSKVLAEHLLPCVVKPLATADWWEKTLDVLEALGRDVSCYEMEFDTSGDIVAALTDLVASRGEPSGDAGAGGRA